jgi:hypothetical protein
MSRRHYTGLRWCGSLLTLATTTAPAQAAGIGDSEAVWVAVMMLVFLGAFLSVPAAGFGYMLGHVLSLRSTLLITAALAMLPMLLLWATRSTLGWTDAASVMAFLLPALSTLVWLGWRLAHREARRMIERAR